MKKDRKDLNKEFEADLYRTMYVLQSMTDKIKNFEPISEDQEKNAEECIVIMAHWTSKNPETEKYIQELKHLLRNQINVSHKIQKQKDEIWKRYARPTGQQTF